MRASPLLLVVEPDGTVRTGNAAGRERVGSRLWGAVHPEDRDRLAGALNEARHAAGPVRAEARLRSGDALVWHVEAHRGKLLLLAQPAEGPAAAPIDLVAARHARVVELLPAVAHGAGGVLGAMSSNLHYIDGVLSGKRPAPAGSDEVADALQDAITSTRITTSLVYGLRILVVAPAATDLSTTELVRTAGTLADRALLQSVRLDVADVAYAGHHGHLFQLLIELLVWVGRHARRKPEIAFRARDRWVEIEFVHQGDGVPSVVTAGAVVRELMQRLEVSGRVRQLERSARLRLELPQGAWAGPEPATELPLMLLVEDHDMVARALRRQAQGRFRVEVCESGEAAVARLRERPAPRIVMCDLALPGMSGLALYQTQPPAIQRRFVFVTGGAYQPAMEQDLRASGRPWLRKPVEQADLVAVVDQVLADLTHAEGAAGGGTGA